MDKLEPPKALLLDSSVADNWKKFKQRFNLYLKASGNAEKDDKPKACLFLHVIGEDALEVYNNFKFGLHQLKLDKIIEMFHRYCNPKKNQTFERHNFFMCA